MPLDSAAIRAIVFDYGNTLIPYGRAELDAYGDALAACLEERFGPVDRPAFDAIRQEGRMAPFQGTSPSYRETDLHQATTRLVQALFRRDPTTEDHDVIARVRHQAFLDAVRPGPQALEILQCIHARHPIALLSNYPDAPAIRASLDAIGFSPYFSAVIVSGDLGYCKPHPIAFAAALEALALPAQAVLHVGDNWLADVQGAKRVGMQAAHLTQYTPPEDHPRSPGDREPDLVLSALEELPELLGC